MQIDAFPGDIVIFARVINLLRGIIYESYYFTSLCQRICSIIVLYFFFTYLFCRLFRTFIYYECSDCLSGHHETICRICSVRVSTPGIWQLILLSLCDISRTTIMWVFRSISRGPTVDAHWIHDSPIHSDVESKVRKLLAELGSIQKILGIQVGNTFFIVWLAVSFRFILHLV